MMRAFLDVPARELQALGELWACGVQYLLTGSHAMRFYGIDREANDVDVVTGTTCENAARLFIAIERIIGHEPHFAVEELTDSKKHVNFRADGINLDVLTRLPGVDFEEAFAARQMAMQSETLLPIISKPHLLVSKRMVAETDPDPERRRKEQQDVALLEVESAA